MPRSKSAFKWFRLEKRPPFRRLWWGLVHRLPEAIQGALIRRLVVGAADMSPGFVFKRAETEDELVQAFRILYESYHEAGLTETNAFGLRLTKYHALPTTSVLIAKQGTEVVATVTSIVDSEFGLPLESLWDISELRKSNRRLAEISSLAVKKTHRQKRGKVLLPLFRMVIDYNREVAGVDRLVMVTHPMIAPFYRHVLLFEPITNETKSYEFAQGAPGLAQHMDLSDSWFERVAEVFRSVPREDRKSVV